MSHLNRSSPFHLWVAFAIAGLIVISTGVLAYAQTGRATAKPPFERRPSAQPTPAARPAPRATPNPDRAPTADSATTPERPNTSDARETPTLEGESAESEPADSTAGPAPAESDEPPAAEPPANGSSVKSRRGAASRYPHGGARPPMSGGDPGWFQGDEVVIDPTWGNWKPGCGNYWVDVEYLTWWRRGQTAPPLVTTSPTTTPSTDAGVLGVAGTTVLYGPDAVGGQARPGGRLSFGFWCDDQQTQGVGARAFFLAGSDAQFNASNNDISVLARPFFEVTPEVPTDQNALLIAYPGQLTGNIHVASHSDVAGGDIYLRHMFHNTRQSRVDFLLGYQFSRLDQDLTINSLSNDGSATLSVQDSFSTQNKFNGGTLGLMFVYDRPCWHLDVLAKVGLGSMSETVQISGSKTPETDQGGLLARTPQNIGTYSRSEFAAVPELALTWVWQVRPGWDFSVGYSFIYWSRVMQPGGAIDPQLAVNLSDPFTGALRPAFSFRTDDYWVQGVSFGLGCRF